MMIYGTAWKEDRTRALVELALDAGFRAIDTANQRKHYVEAAVGEAVAASGIRRDALFLQTKFTFARGQDHRLPYDPEASFGDQVRQSFARSLEHLQTDYVDALLLHGPWGGAGLAAADREVWGALAALDGVRAIGLSNVSAEQVTAFSRLGPTPAWVQNRCYARTGWDREVRAVCRDLGIRYQGFSLLTANTRELAHPDVVAIAARVGRPVASIVFAFCAAIGIVPLTGTSDVAHMRADLACDDITLTAEEVARLDDLTA